MVGPGQTTEEFSCCVSEKTTSVLRQSMTSILMLLLIPGLTKNQSHHDGRRPPTNTGASSAPTIPIPCHSLFYNYRSGECGGSGGGRGIWPKKTTMESTVNDISAPIINTWFRGIIITT